MIVCVSAYQFKYRIDIKKLDYDTTIQTCVKKYHQHAALQTKKQLAAQQQEAKNENEDTTQENDMLRSVEEERNDKVTESNCYLSYDEGFLIQDDDDLEVFKTQFKREKGGSLLLKSSCICSPKKQALNMTFSVANAVNSGQIGATSASNVEPPSNEQLASGHDNAASGMFEAAAAPQVSNSLIEHRNDRSGALSNNANVRSGYSNDERLIPLEPLGLRAHNAVQTEVNQPQREVLLGGREQLHLSDGDWNELGRSLINEPSTEWNEVVSTKVHKEIAKMAYTIKTKMTYDPAGNKDFYDVWRRLKQHKQEFGLNDREFAIILMNKDVFLGEAADLLELNRDDLLQTQQAADRIHALFVLMAIHFGNTIQVQELRMALNEPIQKTQTLKMFVLTFKSKVKKLQMEIDSRNYAARAIMYIHPNQLELGQTLLVAVMVECDNTALGLNGHRIDGDVTVASSKEYEAVFGAIKHVEEEDIVRYPSYQEINVFAVALYVLILSSIVLSLMLAAGVILWWWSKSNVLWPNATHSISYKDSKKKYAVYALEEFGESMDSGFMLQRGFRGIVMLLMILVVLYLACLFAWTETEYGGHYADLMIVFDTKSVVYQSMQYVEEMDLDALKAMILRAHASGGTNFECGYKKAIDLYLNGSGIQNDEEYDNRIIFLMKSMIMAVDQYSNNAHNYVYTTFVGVGLDFNAKLMEQITATRGCNYYSVQSTADFKRVMNEDFEFMVTPLVFNVLLTLKSEGNTCCIEKVYGASPQKEGEMISTGEITSINTLFPSKQSKAKGGTKGGIQLIKLKPNEDANKEFNVVIEVTFEDKYGTRYKNQQLVHFGGAIATKNDADMIENDESNFYDNKGIRKAILLCKYGELLMEWMKHEEGRRALHMDDEYKNKFNAFIPYFEQEMKQCEDDELQKELDLLRKLVK